MAEPVPPDLRSLCRKLTLLPPTQLPQAVPLLTRHIIRCKDVLSSPQDQKSKTQAQTATLIHKLRTSTTTLLNGRSREGRFAAIGLVKALVDVGGWEMLRVSGPWVSGLLSIIQKGDPYSFKELAIVTLTRIYMGVHPYQTLVREMAIPTIPAFTSACLELIARSTSDHTPGTSLTMVETICDAFSALNPLYPATFRPRGPQIRSLVRCYLAPTLTDDLHAPQSLRRSARKIVIYLSCTSVKSGGSDGWSKLVNSLLQDLHATADQVLRAVDESWNGTEGYNRQNVSPAGKPSMDHGSIEQLPPWRGLTSGAQRLEGFFDYLADCLRYPTPTAVAIPIGALMEAISRVCLVARLNPKTQTWDQSVVTSDAISHEEKEDLWSAIPEIHISALGLISMMIQRLGRNMIPFAQDLLDHAVRVFRSSIALAEMRMAGYKLTNSILLLVGPTMSKRTVDRLEPLIAACCRDLQEDAGFLTSGPKPSASLENGHKKSSQVNADLFLKPQASAAEHAVSLDVEHKHAASDLLTGLLSQLPQHHLKPTLRGLLDKTAILTRNRDAMVASVLNPYKDQSGRMYPSILPHLSQQYPQDQALEILRSNITISHVPGTSDVVAAFPEVYQEEEENDGDLDNKVTGDEKDLNKEAAQESIHEILQTAPLASAKRHLPIQPNPFQSKAQTEPTTLEVSPSPDDLPTKRKHEQGEEEAPAKRHLAQQAVASLPEAAPDAGDDDDNASDASVGLDMELEGDDDEDDEDE